MTGVETVCAVDVGSTAIKAAIYTHGLNVVGQSVTNLRLNRSETNAEVNPEELWQVVTATIRTSIDRAGRPPTTIVLATQMAGQCLMDAHHHPIGPIVMGLDRRHDPNAGPMRDSRQSLRLAWWARHRPHDLRALHRFGGIKEYLLWRATQRWVTDPSSASVSGFYDPSNQSWTPPAIIAHAQLPTILPSEHSIGTLTPKAASELGLTTSTAVLCGIGDGPASSLSAGAVGPGRLCLTLGTTSVARLLMDAGTAGAIPAPTPTTFIQHIHGGWYCTGIRAEGGVALGDIVDQWNVDDVRVIGGRSTPATLQHVANQTRRPTRATTAKDGTLGAALFAYYPQAWLKAASALPIAAEVSPAEVPPAEVPPTVRTRCQS